MTLSPDAALTAAEDLIALAEYAYAAHVDDEDRDIEDVRCTTTSACVLHICTELGCIVRKYHLGMVLRAACIAAIREEEANR